MITRPSVCRFLNRFQWQLTLLCLGAWISSALGAELSLVYDREDPRAKFAADEIAAALRSRGDQTSPVSLARLGETGGRERIVLATAGNPAVLQAMRAAGTSALVEQAAEGYGIRTASRSGKRSCWVIGTDSGGLMYGGLELAETILLDGLARVKDADASPHMAMRGTKFNIPLDVRTPSYTHPCDAAQQNIAEMWSMDFWKEYLDSLARYRFNFVSCWSLHPFPSLVRVPDYPDVALADVQRSTVDWKETYSLEGRGFDAPEIVNNVETLRRMTIDDKIGFWREVMRYGKARNIDFYFVTWNIFVNGTGGKYGITDRIDNPVTTDYFRKSVEQMFLTYPLLKGIGLTTGENMPKASFEEKEDWAFKTYAQGVLDVARKQPGRQITFVHRQHMTGAKDIARRFAPLIEHPDIEFIFSFKYAKAHVFSSTTQPYHRGFVDDLEEEGGLKTIWTLRNDDNYYFRWGAPDFVREFIANIPHDVSRGFYYGSDQYIWGREFLSKQPETPRQLEVVKHWYHWLMWGRLGYDPELSNARFAKILDRRYPEVSGGALLEAWQHASMIYPLTTGFHWGALDFQWYIEGCKSQPGPAQTKTGFHDVNRFITLPPHKGTDYLSIPEYVQRTRERLELTGTTPIELARQISRHANAALAMLASLDAGANAELEATLGDIRSMAYLGKYYAHKIRGATELALFRDTGVKKHQNAAVRELTAAADYWRLYTTTALERHHNPLWTNRVGHVDWVKLTELVLADIRIASEATRQAAN